MAVGNEIHGREGILYLSTSTGTTALSAEVGAVDAWSVSMTRDINELTHINQDAKSYIEGLIGGSLTANGSLRPGDTVIHKLYNRFFVNEVDTDSGGWETQQSGNLYFHLILKPVDTAAASTADYKGAKLVAAGLSGGLSFDVSGGDVESWSYDGTVNGDVYYVESTDTGRGIPSAN
jgi:hypothetical protein